MREGYLNPITLEPIFIEDGESWAYFRDRMLRTFTIGDVLRAAPFMMEGMFEGIDYGIREEIEAVL